MTTRLARLVIALGLLLGAALPSAAAAVVRPPTSPDIAASSVPPRGADAANASSYFGARYYGADVGRFTTVDPVVDVQGALQDPQRWNRYAYVRNNPLRYVDPDGRDPQDPQAQKSFFVNSMTFLGSALGALIGGTGGAAGGTFVEPVGGTIAGGAYGALQGSVLGAAAGRSTAEAIVAGVSYMSDASEGHGGGKTGRKFNPDRRDAAKTELEKAEGNLKEARGVRTKTAEQAQRVRDLEARVKHLRRKLVEISEEHARQAQR